LRKSLVKNKVFLMAKVVINDEKKGTEIGFLLHTGLVPILEPKILPDGDHGIERTL